MTPARHSYPLKEPWASRAADADLLDTSDLFESADGAHRYFWRDYRPPRYMPDRARGRALFITRRPLDVAKAHADLGHSLFGTDVAHVGFTSLYSATATGGVGVGPDMDDMLRRAILWADREGGHVMLTWGATRGHDADRIAYVWRLLREFRVRPQVFTRLAETPFPHDPFNPLPSGFRRPVSRDRATLAPDDGGPPPDYPTAIWARRADYPA